MHVGWDRIGSLSRSTNSLKLDPRTDDEILKACLAWGSGACGTCVIQWVRNVRVPRYSVGT
jgi:hypothetical protein